jgi:hypothetical protein
MLKKQKTNMIAMILLLALFASTMFSLQTVKAVDRVTYTYIAVAPNPVGVNQGVQVTMWTQLLPPSGANFAVVVQWDFTVTITGPDGGTQTKQLLSDPIGGAWFSFTPTVLGTYRFKAAMAQEVYQTTTYLASSSNEISLVVQAAQVEYWPSSPLPNEFWTRPINGQNRDWSTISGNWVGMPQIGFPEGVNYYDANGKFNPYTTGPESAHILWSFPVAYGGLAGGQYGSTGYYSGDSYELKCFPHIIMNGIFYRNIPQTNNRAGGGFEAISLYTGEVLWKQETGSIAFGQILQYDSLNQHGAIPYLWSAGAVQVYDAWTGKALFNFTNLPFGGMATPLMQDEKGNLIAYALDATKDRLVMWNSTRAISYGAPAGSNLNAAFGAGNPDYWRPNNNMVTYNGTAGIEWNVTIPDLGVSQSINRIDQRDGVILARAANVNAKTVYEAGYSTKDGHMIWNQTRTGDNALIESDASFSQQSGDGIYVAYKQETRQWFGYDVNTGVQKWITDPIENNWATYTCTIGDGPAYIAYGKVYTTDYSGTLHCYDVTNGHNLWNFNVGSSGFETPYGSWPLWGGLLIADGKVYVSTGEHSPNQPIYRGETFSCVDAETGDFLWNITGWMMNPIIADGYIVTFNSYDMQNYCFGKGPSATTVSAPVTTVPVGTGVLIQGSVTDESPGTEQLAQAARFPHGVPAISDKDMTSWMNYLYMQQPKPTNATGVPVFLQAVKSDGTVIDLWHATSDMLGHYEYTWTPPDADTYKIIATFEGSASYWPSTEECAVSVGPAATAINIPSANDVASQVVSQLPVQTPVPTAPSASDVASEVISQLPSVSNTDLAIIAVVVVAILIGLANLVLQFRKK